MNDFEQKKAAARKKKVKKKNARAVTPLNPSAEAWLTKPEPYRPQVMLSDAGNAYRFAVEHGDTIRYVDVWNSFLIWDGARWGFDRVRQVEHLAKQTVVEMYKDASAELQRAIDSGDKVAQGVAKAMLGWAIRSHSAKALAAMLNLARSEPTIARLPDVFDLDIWALNTPTGTVDLKTGLTRPHCQADYLRIGD